jgi:uncharacterized membrane protein (DUF4010 family)
MLGLTHYAIVYMGSAGVYGLAALTGFTDIAPFVLGLANTVGTATPFAIAAAGIVIAAASNNAVKAGYACAFSDRKTGIQSAALLAAYSLMGLLPLFWISR